MAEEAQVNSEILVTTAAETDVVPIKVKEVEEATLDGEFIKVEKEPFDAKDGSHHHATETSSVMEEDKPSIIEKSMKSDSAGTRELLEAEEKIRELEHELERVARVLKHSESENAKLKDEFTLTKEKFEESGKKCEDLELDQKKLKEQIMEAEERQSVQLNSLKDALEAQEAKHKEMINIKEAFDKLSLELESSRKKSEEFERELQCSSDEARKFEELHKQSSFNAESEMKRALELEKLLESAKRSTEQVEDQMASLQDELKGLYVRMVENEKVEDALTRTKAELCDVQEVLQLSKSHVLDIEQRLSSKESLIDELKKELDTRKASESQAKEDILALENLFTSTKEEFQAKVYELEEIKMNLEKEVKMRELIEADSRTHEVKASSAQEELARVIKEKEALKTAVGDLTTNVAHMKEVCMDLETKLKASDKNFSKADSLLSQALSNNAELEEKLKSFEELYCESVTVTQKNAELEDILRASNAAAEEAKSQLSEVEAQFIVAKQKNIELEQQLNLVELKSSDAERELQESSEKVSAIDAKLKAIDEEKQQLNGQIQEYEDKITRLESILHESSLRNSQLVEELKNAVEKCADHEVHATSAHQRNLELEDLFQMSHSKVHNADKKASELELLLETEKYRTQELEKRINTLENRCDDVESESKKHFDKASILAAELEAFETKGVSLEEVLKMANERERELTECLNVTSVEKKMFKEASDDSNKKLAEAENLTNLLRDELDMTQEKLESIENELKQELNQSLVQVASLGSSNEELKRQVSGLGDRAAQSSSENESLVETNTQLKSKIQELQELLASAISEKEAVAGQVDSHINSITELTDRHHQAYETAETRRIKLEEMLPRLKELECVLKEAQNKSSQFAKESEGLAKANLKLAQELAAYKSEINDLLAKLAAVSTQKDESVEQLHSSKQVIEDLTQKLDSEAKKLQSQMSSLVEENSQLKQANQDAENEIKTVKIQLEGLLKEHKANEDTLKVEIDTLKAEIAEKSALSTCLKELEQQLTVAEAQRKEEVESIREIATVREAELSSRLEDLFHKVHDKDALSQQVVQLQKELELAQSSNAEQRKANSQVELEREAFVKSSVEELDTQKKQVTLLQEQVKELDQKLELAYAKSKEKQSDESGPVEIKSRNMEPNLSKRKSKKKSESTLAPTSSPTVTQTQTSEVSSAIPFKIILGVALVSIIVGIILGKKY